MTGVQTCALPIYGDDTFFEFFDFCGIVVDAPDVISAFREATAGDKSNITSSDYCNVHYCSRWSSTAEPTFVRNVSENDGRAPMPSSKMIFSIRCIGKKTVVGCRPVSSRCVM